ncbi:MAG TPA: AAA family ATPase [Myxococcota bacterium]|nr:AAA family ATPase [Myxococcota bacterium]
MSNGRPATTEAFALTSDPAAYVPSADRERALEQMTAALESGAISCLEGPTGIGKTLLLQLLAQRLSDRFEPVYMPYPMLSSAELCQFALGLLERSYSGDPETALLQLASERAAHGRALLLLIDDASSLPPDSARGLAALRAQSRGTLHLGFAGIGGGALLDAMAPFGDTLLRVALDEGIPQAGLRDYVVAQLDHANVSAKLRAAFDDDVLDALAREASGNPRRLHLAAQTILRRAEGRPPSGSPPPALVETEPSRPSIEPIQPPPRIEPTPPPPPVEVPPIAQAALPPNPPPPLLPAHSLDVAPTPPPVEPSAIRPEPAPPRPVEPVHRVPAARSEALSSPSPPPPTPRVEEPIGEYRIVRRRPPAEPPPPAPTPPPLRPVAAPPARHEIETPRRESSTATSREPAPTPIPSSRRSEAIAAPKAEPSEPIPPQSRPPWEMPARARPKKPVPQSRTTERALPYPLVVGVAIVSALIGFALASRFERLTGPDAPARPAPSEATRVAPQPAAPLPPPAARPIEEPPSPPPAAPEPETQATANPVAPTPSPAATPAPAPTTPVPAPQAERPATAPKPAARSTQRIDVSINATPWAVIEVDGRELGETPLGGIALDRGTHHFVARFPNGRVVERSVEIDASHRALVFE